MWSAAIPKPAENMHSDDTTPHNAQLRIIRCTREDAEVGAALAVALRGDELHGLDVEAQGLDRAGEAVLGLGEGADGCHCRVPFSNRAAPIATSMVVVRPGTIGPHPKGTASAPDGRRRLFFLLRDAKRGTRGGKKLAAAVAGRRSRRSRSSVRPNPFEAERWTAQMEIIWNTTASNGISQTTTAAPCWPQKARPSMAGFLTAFRGDTVGL